eukprot:CAMPEP_0116842254 /NCGR_PEP_ID=MMETSP0418-20121206/11408_1 /TAXON_ID=1158023 /ORGANISM="Astrosyne radiata, Strain 13vi08-1A" /LENGTH=280 /DNA_ID=CAMNT_0004472831 /DNA_START=104 /DNA_END=947 /DNA_ORIENTATION=-
MEPKSIKSPGMLLSVAEAMSRDTRMSVLCDAIRKDLSSATLTAFKYAAVSEFVREQIVFLESGMKMNEDLELSFPTIGSFLDSVEVLSLIRDAKTSDDLKKKRPPNFPMVANSKDLRPRFAVMGRSKKKNANEAMLGIVDRLRVQWKPVLDNGFIEERKKSIKEEIRNFLKEDTGKKNLNVRADQRWIQGLNYVHSTENQNAFGIANSSKRLIELDVDYEIENYKIPPPSVRVYSALDMQQLLQEQSLRMARAREVKSAVQSKRRCTILDPESSIFPADL